MKLEHDPRFYDLVAWFLTALDSASLTVSEQRYVLGHTGSTVSWELHSDLKNFGSELALNWVDDVGPERLVLLEQFLVLLRFDPGDDRFASGLSHPVWNDIRAMAPILASKMSEVLPSEWRKAE